jgi:hypothetical protein
MKKIKYKLIFCLFLVIFLSFNVVALDCATKVNAAQALAVIGYWINDTELAGCTGGTGGLLGKNGDNIYYNGGNFGIGTIGPDAKLEVSGDSTYTGAGGGQIRISGATDNNKRIEMGFNTGENIGFIQSYQNTGTIKPLNLNPNGGYVGIGITTQPTEELDVNGDIKSSGTICGVNGCIGDAIKNTAIGSSAIAIGGSASSLAGIALGSGAVASGTNGQIAIGWGASATSGQSIAIGRATSASNADEAMALGYASSARGQRSVAIGRSANAGHSNSIALGPFATTTSSNQLMVGSDTSSLNVVVKNGDLDVSGTLTVGGQQVTAGGSDCPANFFPMESQGNRLGCIQINENGVSDPGRAGRYCFESHGGRLPTPGELMLADDLFSSFVLNLRDNYELTNDWASYNSVIRVSGGGDLVEGTSSAAYRCFIPG